MLKITGIFFLILILAGCDLFEIPVDLGPLKKSGPAGVNMMSDPGFESSVSGVEADYPPSTADTTDDPVISGNASLLVKLQPYASAAWTYNFPFDQPYYGKYLRMVCKVRILTAASGLHLAAGPRFYYDEPSPAPVFNEMLMPLDTAGKNFTVNVTLAIDSAKPLSRLLFYFRTLDGAQAEFLVDEAYLYFQSN
jgi:hypothetical protein